jgi:peptidoglycan/xylan/chitin deacetylase (PgdA/CDA1 family)
MFVPAHGSGFVPYISHGERDCGKIAITIDDGWLPENVQQALEYLGETPASFFIVGRCLASSPELYARAMEQGCEVHNHTFDHTHLNEADMNLREEIRKWEEAYALMGLGAYRHKVLRAPANQGVNDPQHLPVLSELGYRALVGWTHASPGVRSCFTSDEVIAYLSPRLRGGDIILLHFTAADVAALPRLIEAATAKGLQPVALTGLPGCPIYQEPFTRAHNIPR